MTQHGSLSADKAKLLEMLFRVGAIRAGGVHRPFTLNLRTDSHPESPGPLTDELVNEIALRFGTLLLERGIMFNMVAPIPHSGLPFGRAMVELAGGPTALKLATFEKGDYAPRKRLTGFRPGTMLSHSDEVVILDTHLGADSTREAVAIFREFGVNVRHVLAIFDRNDRVCEALRSDTLAVHTLLSFEEAASYLDLALRVSA